jgi:hypothetical protein
MLFIQLEVASFELSAPHDELFKQRLSASVVKAGKSVDRGPLKELF